MSSVDLTYQIGLTLLDGVGDVLAKNLVAYCGSAEQVFKTGKAQLEKIPGIGTYTSNAIFRSKTVLERAEQEVRFVEDKKIEALFFTDKNYPQRLKNCSDSPIMLYYKGSTNLNAEKIVAVVGTRTPSLYGKLTTEKLIEDLVESGCLVVSGLAYGIDITSHKSALDRGLDTVGVLAHGLDRVYPSAHTTYAKRMISQGGLLTEFLSETNPDKENFPKRNRIVAGMCDALVVVESKRGGGSLITATIANSYNKDIFAFPGKATDVLSEGCNGLIKSNRANLIESAADLLYMMNWNEEVKKKKTTQIPLLIDLSPEEQLIINAFESKNQLHVDEICYATNFTISKTSTYLLQLEFSNVIKSLPGKIYQLNR
ncbi:MAG: protecting protein DprA [Bacteroidetes bacterium]|jgi:DNA processing protein|nr:protecting protein DprA [Bacteroidota bacterium]MDF2451273.1 protecting protein DprA [Bacteroidota bacterium]